MTFSMTMNRVAASVYFLEWNIMMLIQNILWQYEK